MYFIFLVYRLQILCNPFFSYVEIKLCKKRSEVYKYVSAVERAYRRISMTHQITLTINKRVFSSL